MRYGSYQGRPYEVVAPCADNDQLAKDHERLILYHTFWGEPEFIVAPANVLHAGYVIGVFID